MAVARARKRRMMSIVEVNNAKYDAGMRDTKDMHLSLLQLRS
jgi:hypothetical protein